MEKTEQQKRFEAAASRDFELWRNAEGFYANPFARVAWEWFKAGEASALERAAKVCDMFALHHADNYHENGGRYDEGQSDSADQCAEAIRALAQEDV